jgi:hypothetical protein
VLLVAALAAPAAAQSITRVRVTADRATIWRPGFLTPAALVDRDTILDVVGRRGNWLEVALPAGITTERQTGFIAVTQVVVLAGALPPDEELAGPRAPDRAAASRAPRAGGSAAAVRVRGFGDVGVTSFLAKDTFTAVFDRSTGVFYGGGAEVRVKDVFFVQAAVRRFRDTGERVFVSGGDVFKLGIADTLTLTPVTVTVGGQVPLGRIVPYAGAGLGRERVQETSAFADPGENTDAWFRTYHLVGGVEWRPRGVIAVAGDVSITHVPDALSGNVSDAFEEHNLGGIDVRIRVLIGR